MGTQQRRGRQANRTLERQNGSNGASGLPEYEEHVGKHRTIQQPIVITIPGQDTEGYGEIRRHGVWDARE